MSAVPRRVPLGAALLTVSAAGSLLLLRPWLRRWGATTEEAARWLPGDEILPVDASPSTMAATIDAPPRHVWPWLVQMGSGRGGWYSWDRLDNGGAPSAERVVPEWQDLNVGDRVPSTVTGHTWFTVARLEPERTLVFRGPVDLDTGWPFDPRREHPRRFLDSTWGFYLEALPGERTRLLVRTRAVGRPRLGTDVLTWLFFDPAHVVMQTRQFRNLRRRAVAAYWDELRGAWEQIPQARGSPPAHHGPRPHHW